MTGYVILTTFITLFILKFFSNKRVKDVAVADICLFVIGLCLVYYFIVLLPYDNWSEILGEPEKPVGRYRTNIVFFIAIKVAGFLGPKIVGVLSGLVGVFAIHGVFYKVRYDLKTKEHKIWYFASGEEKKGPFSRDEFFRLKKEGKLKPETYIWKKGMENWVKLMSFDEAF